MNAAETVPGCLRKVYGDGKTAAKRAEEKDEWRRRCSTKTTLALKSVFDCFHFSQVLLILHCVVFVSFSSSFRDSRNFFPFPFLLLFFNSPFGSLSLSFAHCSQIKSKSVLLFATLSFENFFLSLLSKLATKYLCFPTCYFLCKFSLSSSELLVNLVAFFQPVSGV